MDKMWYTSKVLWASIIGILVGIFKLAGVDLSADLQVQLVDLIIGFATIAAGGVTWYERFRVQTPIAKALISKGTMQTDPIAMIVALVFVGVLLSGCSSMMQFTADAFKLDVVSESAKKKVYKGALLTFVAWGGAPTEECLAGITPAEECIGGIQKVIYHYGKLTPCQTTESLLCRDDEAWAKIKSIELATTHTLAATRPALAAGTNDIELLLALPEVVHDAQAAINAAINAGKTTETAQ